MAVHDGEGQKYADAIKAGGDGREYYKAVHRLNRNLNNILFDDDGETFWLCFRGGLIRRADYNGNLSPLFAKVRKGQDGEMTEPFTDHFNHTVLYKVLADRLVILEHTPFSQIFLKDLPGYDKLEAKIDEVCPVLFQALTEEDLPELDMPDTRIYSWENMIYNNMF